MHHAKAARVRTLLVPAALLALFLFTGCRRTQSVYPSGIEEHFARIPFGKNLTDADARAMGYESFETTGGLTVMLDMDARREEDSEKTVLHARHFHFTQQKLVPRFQNSDVFTSFYQFKTLETAQYVLATLTWDALHDPFVPQDWKGQLAVEGSMEQAFWKEATHPAGNANSYYRREFQLYFHMEEILLSVRILQPRDAESAPSLAEMKGEAVRVMMEMFRIARREKEKVAGPEGQKEGD